MPPAVIDQVEIHLKYEGYIRRQLEQVARLEQLEAMPLPESCSSWQIPGLSYEICGKLARIQPATLGQAARILASRQRRSLSSWSIFRSTVCSVPVMQEDHFPASCRRLIASCKLSALLQYC